MNIEAALKLMLADSNGVAPTDDEVLALIDLTVDMAVNVRYPYGGKPEDAESVVMEKYSSAIVEAASAMYHHSGIEGEAAHTEGSTTRTFGSADPALHILKNRICSLGVVGSAR